MQIRIAKPAELPIVAILDHRVNKTPWTMMQYEECLANRNQTIYVLEINAVICGMLIISKVFDEVEILQLAIAKSYQKKNLATFLIRSVLSNLSGTDYIAKVFLEVCVENTPALALYKKLGFTRISIRKNYYVINGAKFDALVMMLDFTQVNWNAEGMYATI